MTLYTLMLEGHKNVFPATLDHVETAIQKMASSTGPTFLNLKDTSGSWAQAGGTNGRYRVEVRDVYGEGFQHWMAALPGCEDRSQTVVYYRNKCLEKKHAPRRCPLDATVANVVSLADVLVIMTTFLATGARSANYSWDDISQSWMDDEVAEKGLGIKVIKPKANKP